MLFLFLIGAQYNVNAQGLTVSDIQNSGCLSETRENRAGDDDEYEENRSIILTKEGNTLKVQLLNYIDNCGIWGFDVIPYVSGGSNGEPYTVSISVNPILGLDRAACVCPYDVSFTLNGLETNSFNFSCYWCEGVVSLTDGEPLVIENSWDDIGVNGLNYKIHKVMHSAKLSDGKAWEGELSIPSELNYEGQKYTVTSIESSAFGNNTKLTSVTIPSSVISIGYGAFSGCSNLANITIPNSVIRIENNAFSNTAWYNNQPDGVVYAGRIAYKCKGALPEGTDITIKEGTYAIANEAFHNCNGLASVTIPGSVTLIGDSSFKGCGNLASVTISEGVMYIGEVAFRDCSSLESITIPKSITKIADFAFYGCKSLASVNLSEGLTRMGIFVFADCTSLSSITIPGSLTNAREYTFANCTNLTSVVFSEGVKSIEQSIFFHCNNLSTISIPKSIKSIYGYVFSELSNLADFYCFADSVPKITKEAFFGTPIASATLHVPAGSIEKYKTTSPWKDFGNIVPITYYPEGTKWTEIRLDTLKYDSWYSKVGDEWVPNFETVDYYVKGEYDGGYRDYKLIYTNGPEWTDSLTLLISESQYGLEVTVAVFHENEVFFPPGWAYGFGDWKEGNTLSYQTINGVNTPIIPPAGIREFGTITEIKEAYFGGVCPLKYVDLNGTRIINGIGVTEWNDGECIFGPVDPYFCYYAMSLDLPKERNYRSMLVHFERNGEVLYDVWPAKETVSFTKDQMATIILPTEPDASKGRYYRLDRCEKGKIIFEEELSPKARTPYIIVPKEDFSIDLNALDLDGLLRDTVSVKGASFIGSYSHEELSCQDGFYIDIIDATPDCQADDSNQRKAIVGALRACLIVSWDDPYNPGGSKGITEKRELVLKDNGTSLTPNPSPVREGSIYDLQGRRLSGKPAKGLYIQNGVKRVVR